MEKQIMETDIQAAHEAVVQELKQKIGTFALCLLAFFVLGKLMMSEATLFEILEFAFTFSLMLYLPFKICYRATGSVLFGVILSFVLVVILGLVVDGSNVLLSLILLGGLAVDFGSSIYKLIKIRKMLN